jgi:hypothetical protein
MTPSRGLSFFLIVIFSVPHICWAEPSGYEDHIPSKKVVKESLLSYWENNLAKDPGTRLFQKTRVAGVYDIDTTVLPYKGRVKVLNVFVDVYKPVGIYDKQIAYGGVVETELMDAPSNLAENQPFSFKKWQQLSWFDYDTKTSEWFPFNDWDNHFPPERRAGVGVRNGVFAVPSAGIRF